MTKHSIVADVPTWVNAGGTWVAVNGSSPGYVQDSLFDAKGDLITATADNTPVRKAVGANGEFLVADSAQTDGLDWRTIADADVPATHSGSAHSDFLPGAVARASRTAGNITANSTTWANVDTGMDLVLAAVTGDWIVVGVGGQWNSEAVAGYLDAVSLVSAAPVNAWLMDAAPNDTHTPGQWVGVASVFSPISGSVVRQVVAGDLSGGNLTLRLRYRTSSAANKTLVANSNNPLIFWAHNLRQP